MTARIAVGVKGPRATKVASLATMTPAFFSPMKAMKKPMPAEIAKRRFFGIQRTICSRDIEGGEQDEDDPFDEDGCETSLPAVTHTHDEGEGEEGIDTHAGSLGEGQLS